MMSVGQNVFAVCSASGFITVNKEGMPHIAGTAILEKGHICNNIFSTDFYKNTMLSSAQAPHGMSYSMHAYIYTRRPITIMTTFFEAYATAQIEFIKEAYKPADVRGSVSLSKGTLHFPYKPLFITHGILHLASQYDGMMTDMTAENTIKGYRIHMQAQGSIRRPHITFESNPDLTQEQIIALLCGGSEDGSLVVAMSGIVMDSVQQLLFGTSPEASATLRSLKALFKPIGSVRFMPSFTDESARGGLRGSLAIEVNDRLRGMIKQNFDLPQDTSLEVEYALSDDACVRGFKDERGDVGAELEASWKF
jgi:hypothetical protein